MTESFATWAQNVNGKAVNVEPGLGAQCYGLIQNYFTNVLGYTSPLSTQTGPHPGYAINVYDGANSIGIAPYVQKLPANIKPQQGDVAFWNWGSPLAPESHTAVVNKDAGNNVQVYSQNSPQKFTTLQELPKAGIAGYLRPIVHGNNNNNANVVTEASNIQPIANTSQTPADSPIWGWVKDLIGPQLAGFFTTLFMPSTWIRVMAGIGGVVLVIIGVTLIIKDYGNHE